MSNRLVSEPDTEANFKRIKLPGGGLVTLSATNMFTMAPADRTRLLGLLETLESYAADEAPPPEQKKAGSK